MDRSWRRARRLIAIRRRRRRRPIVIRVSPVLNAWALAGGTGVLLYAVGRNEHAVCPPDDIPQAPGELDHRLCHRAPYEHAADRIRRRLGGDREPAGAVEDG